MTRLVPFSCLLISSCRPTHSTVRAGGRKRRSAPTERAVGQIARRGAHSCPRKELDDFGSHNVQQNDQSQVLAERGICPRTPFIAELANLASGMQSKQRDW